MRRETERETGKGKGETRSEEHTSELQSQSNLVCRLLLEKKNHKSKAHCYRPYPTLDWGAPWMSCRDASCAEEWPAPGRDVHASAREGHTPRSAPCRTQTNAVWGHGSDR